MSKQADAKRYLIEDYGLGDPKTRLWVDVTHISDAGWRYLKVYIILTSNDEVRYLYNISYLVATALGLRLDRNRNAVRTQEYPAGIGEWLGRALSLSAPVPITTI